MMARDKHNLPLSGCSREFKNLELLSKAFQIILCDRIYMMSSPMIRAIQTAAIIAEKIGIDRFAVNNGFVEHLDPGCAK
jgi:broad specificity phosphatase PhoE